MFRRIAALFLLVCNLVLMLAIFLAAMPEAGSQGIALPILMYHHIHSSPSRWGAYVVSPETFEGDLAYLAAHGYTAVSMAELLAFCAGEGSLPEKPVMITFDDGQLSFEAYALPLLEKYDMCAVVAAVGAYADIYTETEDHNINYACFSWPELKALEASPRVEVASHTYDMHGESGRLGCKIAWGESAERYAAVFRADMDSMEARFQEYLGISPIAFAYPYGAACAEAKSLLIERGYRVLFTCREQVNRLTGDPAELLSLGRFNRPNSMDRAAFFAQFEKN